MLLMKYVLLPIMYTISVSVDGVNKITPHISVSGSNSRSWVQMQTTVDPV